MQFPFHGLRGCSRKMLAAGMVCALGAMTAAMAQSAGTGAPGNGAAGMGAAVMGTMTGGIPLPKVAGPIPATDTSKVFMAADRVVPAIDLAKADYVEEEYFVSGTGNIYQYDSNGNVAVKTANAPYTDRILVRLPADKAHFSGSVMVEILNPATGSQAPIWDYSHNYFMKHGDAWIGVTSKPGMADTLKTFNPARYAPLSWPSSSCNGAPAKPDYGVFWDILSQVSALVRSDSAGNPLEGFKVQKVYLLGKTGGDAPAYIISIHPLASAQYGKPIFDGYVVNSSFGSGQIPLNACAPRSGLVRTVPPRGVPVMNVQSETDVVALNGGWQNRRPDSDAAPDLYRLYEVPGSSHIDKDIDGPPVPEDLAVIHAVPFAQMDCVEKVPLNPFPLHYVFDAVFANLEKWTRDGVAPPRAARLEISINGEPPKASPLLDQNGNALGGVRTPFLDVPTATYYPVKTGPDGSCGYAGYAVPFEKARLKELYPTHEMYVSNVSQEVDQMVKARWLTEDDGAEIKAAAQNAAVPGGGE